MAAICCSGPAGCPWPAARRLVEPEVRPNSLKMLIGPSSGLIVHRKVKPHALLNRANITEETG